MKKKILYIVVFFVVLILALFIVLKNGIVISSIQFDFLKLEQLYIKLDKKLIVRAKNITINETQNSEISSQTHSSDNASTEILKITKNLKYLYTFVKEIDIQKDKIDQKWYEAKEPNEFNDGFWGILGNYFFV